MTKQIESLLHSLRHSTHLETEKKIPHLKTFIFTDNRNIKTFLGINIDPIDNGFHLAQPFLIIRILKIVRLSSEDNMGRNTKDTPTKPLLIKDINNSSRMLLWKYRSVIRMLNFLSGSTHPDIAIAVYQVVCFCSCPHRSHKKAVMRIARYLQCIAKFRLFYKINLNKGLEVYIATNFAGL